jgi:hypothetical protein
MKRLAKLMALATLGLCLLTGAALANGPFQTDLVVGRTMNDVGDVQVWNNSTTLYVKYVLENGWCAANTHLAVGDALSDIPVNPRGCPPPGRFPYKGKLEYPIPLADVGLTVGETAFIAAHADVYGAFGQGLPETPVEYHFTGFTNAGENGWLNVDIKGLPGLKDGNYPVWCIDKDHSILPVCTWGDAKVFATCNNVEGLVDPADVHGDVSSFVYYPDNMPRVICLLNKYAAGDVVSIGDASVTLTDEDIQNAIWNLIENNLEWPAEPYRPAVVSFLLAYANSSGCKDFDPKCKDGQKMGIVFFPVNEYGAFSGDQIFLLLAPCKGETAWGEGEDFGDCANWAMYFNYPVQAPAGGSILTPGLRSFLK